MNKEITKHVRSKHVFGADVNQHNSAMRCCVMPLTETPAEALMSFLMFFQDCLIDFSNIDIILISNYHFMLALPFITEVSRDL